MKTTQVVGADIHEGAAEKLLVTNVPHAAGTHQMAQYKDWKLPLVCWTGWKDVFYCVNIDTDGVSWAPIMGQALC